MHDVVGFFRLTHMTSIKTRRTIMIENEDDDDERRREKRIK